MEHPDVLIIGTGTAGQSCAYDLVKAGYNVAIAEHSGRPGGVCALSGCQPKKWFYEAAETVARSRHLYRKGITTPPAVSWEQILEAKNKFTDQVPGSTVDGLKKAGIRFLQGAARFTSPETVQVKDAVIRPRYTVIATGATPMPLPFEGSEHLAVSDEFLELKTLPGRLVLVGGGFISFEFAHFAARLGMEPGSVHIIEAADRPLGPFDAEMVGYLLEATREAGIQVHTNRSIIGVEEHEGGYKIAFESGETMVADMLVHGAGRVANIADLDLDVISVAHSKKGIEVDRSMMSSNPNVYAIGDCAATIQLSRVADFEAHIAAEAIIARDANKDLPTIDYDAVAAVLFTYPQIGMIGKTEDALRREQVDYRKSSGSHLDWPTYRRVGMQHAAYKILVDREDKILGAHVLADNVSGLIAVLRQAMLSQTPVAELYRNSIMTPYPSRESDLIYMLKALLD
jgi:glutathione reductase (NADPH)